MADLGNDGLVGVAQAGTGRPGQSIRDAAGRERRRVVDERLVPSFVWSALNGIADHFTSERRALDSFPAERLVAFSAERLALAITDPA